jgi:D-3-phosphoglycerate dehydrogenase
MFIIDFDSTLISCESLEKLADIALADQPDKSATMAKIAAITTQGMSGEITFEESLEHRLRLFRAHRQHVAELTDCLISHLSVSARKHHDWFKQNADRLYILSGAFTDYMAPVVARLSIPKTRILANRFTYDTTGTIVGFDQSIPLSHSGGKAEMVSKLGLGGPVIVIGDGYTDYEIKAAGLADEFWAFTETVARPKVVAHADRTIASFSELTAAY